MTENSHIKLILWGTGFATMEKCEKAADTLVEKGYRKQEWISVEDRLPESEKIVLASAVSKTFRYRNTLMVAHIGHHEFTTEDTDWREFEGDTEYDEENDNRILQVERNPSRTL